MRNLLTHIGHGVMWGFGITLGAYLGWMAGLMLTIYILDKH